MQILVVEDDRPVSRSVVLMLQSDTCAVHAAALGEDGIDLAKLNGYDIILLDLDLPDLSGYEVLRALRAAGIDTPVLILSGLSTACAQRAGSASTLGAALLAAGQATESDEGLPGGPAPGPEQRLG